MAELRSSAGDRVSKFFECFPRLKPVWRPVTESSQYVELLDARVVLRGKVDLTLGTATASEAGNHAGKVVIDTTNPIADEPPEDGIVRYFTGPNDSLMERLQKAAPEARFVKAWNSVGNHLMINPKLPGGRPTMFICGNDATAKAQVSALLDGFGWDVEDVGTVKGARAIEPLCQLWCAPGFLRNDWVHAYKVLKP